jgi:hypothetical protein
MKGERQMLPVHTIRIRAASPMTKIRSAHVRAVGDGGVGHAVDRSVCPSAACRRSSSTASGAVSG